MLEKPEKLIFELSQNCNLNCVMCGFGGSTYDPSRSFDEKMFQNIAAEKEFLSNIKEIRLNGRGESTINPRFPELVEKIASIFPSARMSLTSNLMFPNEKVLDIINEKKIDLLVSVDSANKNDYESIRRGSSYEVLVNRLQKIESCHLIFTLQKYNIDQILSVGQFARRHRFGFILNVIRVDDQNYKDEFNTLLDINWNLILEKLETLRTTIPQENLFIPDQIWGRNVPENIATTVTSWSLPLCPNASEEMMIAHDGTVYPCCMFNPYTYGNIYEKSLEEIWKSPQRTQFLDTYRENFYCQKCEYMIHK
jgi:MoaA/NifB/PqqE/SkfB family radical SAM enzyme